MYQRGVQVPCTQSVTTEFSECTNEECKCPALKVSRQSLVNVPMRSASALQDPLPSFVALGTHA